MKIENILNITFLIYTNRIMMKNISRIVKNNVFRFRHYFRTIPLSLGRWKLDYSKKQIDSKVDWANEDHCGPCGNNPILNEKPNHNNKSFMK